jgi:hypothetical protein
MPDDTRQTSLLSPHTTQRLAHVINQLLHGSITPGEVTSVLRRACEESRDRPPEQLLLRIKELWFRFAEGSRVPFAERDRRYFAVVGECLVLYHGLVPTQPARHRASREPWPSSDVSGSGGPEMPLQ